MEVSKTVMLRCQKSRKEGGLGDMTMPLLADKNMAISRAYGVLKEDEGLRFEDQKNFPFLKNPSTTYEFNMCFQLPRFVCDRQGWHA